MKLTKTCKFCSSTLSGTCLSEHKFSWTNYEDALKISKWEERYFLQTHLQFSFTSTKNWFMSRHSAEQITIQKVTLLNVSKSKSFSRVTDSLPLLHIFNCLQNLDFFAVFSVEETKHLSIKVCFSWLLSIWKMISLLSFNILAILLCFWYNFFRTCIKSNNYRIFIKKKFWHDVLQLFRNVFFFDFIGEVTQLNNVFLAVVQTL